MVRKEDIYIPCFQTMRTLHVYLPVGYENNKQKYPVFYMYDGHNLFHDEDATFGKSWGMETYFDTHEIPVIVVGIECNHEGNQRLEEFSPYDFDDRYVGHIHGRGKALMEWVVSDLKPWIDLRYRTKTGRRYTAIGGSSMGGLMALYTILHHNDIFSKAACLSCFLYGVMADIRQELKDHLHADTHVYLSWGSEEVRSKMQLAKLSAANLEIIRQLLVQNVEVFPNLVVKGKHNEASWEKELPVFINFLFP